MKGIQLIIILLTLFASREISACSCVNVPKTFSENIRENHTIFRGIVLEHIEIPNDSNYLLIYHSMTKIQVIEWYQNKMKSDTIYYANGQGAMCTSSLECIQKGEQIVAKAVKESIYDPSFEFYPNKDSSLIQFMKNYKNKPTVGYGICDVSILKVKDKMVVGNITKNYQNRKWNRINFIRRISKRWAEKLETKLRESMTKYQSWEQSKFSKFMKKKWNSL